MGRGSGIKGRKWERQAAKELSQGCGYWRRVPGSGSFGTLTGDPSLTGDLTGKYPWWRRRLKGEAKFGYGGSTQLTLRREWMTKIREEAFLSRMHPCLLLKFKGVTGGDRESAKLIIFDFETWLDMMKELGELWESYMKLLEENSKTQ